MKFSFNHSWVLVLTLLLHGLSWTLGLCGTNTSCQWYGTFRVYAFSILEPLLLYTMVAIPLGTGLSFASEAGFRKFLKFAGWWIPLSVVLIFLAPTSGGTFFPMLDMTKEGASWILGALFSIIGLTLVLRKPKTV